MRLVLVGLLSALFLQGCAETQQARKADSSGFLGTDYARLKPGEEGQALLVYRDAKANWGSYDKIRLDPVTVWKGGESAFDGLSAEERQNMADALFAALQKELSQDYKMVDGVGPGVLRIQVALTDAEGSSPVMDTISTVLPVGLAVSEAKGLVTGKPSFVGEAQAEAKITDGSTGELLAAAIDRRVGGKKLAGSFNSMNDVQAAFQYWAQQLRYRLCTSRNGNNCQKPE